MTGFAKLLVGAAATSLLAWGAHAITGERYVDALEERTRAAVSDFGLPEGATLSMNRNPLSRNIVISGVSDPGERNRLRAALRDVPGLGSISFGDAAADESDSAGESSAETTTARPGIDPATTAAVADCQDNVDEVMAGKVINFRSGSAYMPDSSLAVVDEVAAVLTECPGLAIRVEGHTDATGSAAINATMSQERADRVAAALVDRGIEASRITAEGMGSSEPVIEGASGEANRANRRIAFEVSAGSILQDGGGE